MEPHQIVQYEQSMPLKTVFVLVNNGEAISAHTTRDDAINTATYLGLYSRYLDQFVEGVGCDLVALDVEVGDMDLTPYCLVYDYRTSELEIDPLPVESTPGGDRLIAKPPGRVEAIIWANDTKKLHDLFGLMFREFKKGEIGIDGVDGRVYYWNDGTYTPEDDEEEQ